MTTENTKQKAVLFGPFVGELYWECGRFTPMLPYYKLKKYKGQDIKYIILTREERFDLYGKYADILVPLRIEGDYSIMQPNCFRLNNFSEERYHKVARKFRNKFNDKYDIIEHLYPKVDKRSFVNKNQYSRNIMVFKYKPRSMNYELVDNHIPKDKPLVILAPRFRQGFKRNWKYWPDFYDVLSQDKKLIKNFNFVICGKPGEYVADEKHRFYDMNDIQLKDGSSLAGLLLVIMDQAIFTFGSQSAIPNISLLYQKQVLEFGCQRHLHTKTYNVHNSPITFIDDKRYNISVDKIFGVFKRMLEKYLVKENIK